MSGEHEPQAQAQQWVAQLDAAWALLEGAHLIPAPEAEADCPPHAGGEDGDSWVNIRREGSAKPLLARSTDVAFSRARHTCQEEGREEPLAHLDEGAPSPPPPMGPTLTTGEEDTEPPEGPAEGEGEGEIQAPRPAPVGAWKCQGRPRHLQRVRSEKRFSLGAKNRLVREDAPSAQPPEKASPSAWIPPVVPSLIPVHVDPPERAPSLGGEDKSEEQNQSQGAGPVRATKGAKEVRESWAIQSINVSGGGSTLASLGSPRDDKPKAASPAAMHLVATIATCEGLPRMAVMSPFCVVRWEREHRSFRTRTIFNSLVPVWNETFELAFPAVPTLQVEVWNQTAHNREDLLGLGTVSFDPACPKERVHRVLLRRPAHPPPSAGEGEDRSEEGEAATFGLVIRAHRVAVERETEKLVQFLHRERSLALATYGYMEEHSVEAPAFAMVELFHAAGLAAEFLADLLQEPRHHPALRTSRSLLRKMLGVFCRYSRDSCLGLLRPLLAQIQNEPGSLEVRLSYLQRHYEAPVEGLLREEQAANKARLGAYLREILACVRRVAFDIHPDLRMLCQLIAEQLGDDAEAKRRVLGDLLFQKFLCPVIASPSAFGLIPESAQLGNAQSGLVLSKVLVNVGLQRPFSPAHELAVVNDLILASQSAVDAFYALVSGRHSSFTVTLHSVQEREHFRRHLTQQLCVENLEFWEDCQLYRALGDADRPPFARVIFKLYMLPGAERELNLETKTIQRVAARLEESPPDLFDEAADDVLTLLRADSFYKFSGRRRTATISSQLVTSSVRIQCISEICRFYVEHRGSLRQALPSLVEEQVFERLDATLDALSVQYNPHRHAHVLNRSLHWSSTGKLPQPAWLLAASLLTHIGHIYRQYFTESGGGEINDDALSRLTHSEAFLAFCNATAELQLTKVHHLSNNQTLVFWLNLYNTLMLHAYVSVGQPDSHRSWLKFQRASCYEVDGHLYSLWDMEHRVLRAAMPSSKWLHLEGHTRSASDAPTRFAEEDRRLASVLGRPVPYLTFLLCNATTPCPRIRIYHPGSCQKEIVETVKSCLSSHPLLINSREIQVPLLYKWYAKDNGLDKRKALRQLAALLEEGDVKESWLQALKQTPSLKVLYQPAQYQFLPVFDNIHDPLPKDSTC